jgi:lipoic acid synthetase
MEKLEKPGWLKIRYSSNEAAKRIAGFHAIDGLKSVCQSAHCPNRQECWASGTATFMVLGEFCTRSCRFCAIQTRIKPPPPDPKEPEKLAEAIRELGKSDRLEYVVITSVTRDDLADGGSGHIARCVREIKNFRKNFSAMGNYQIYHAIKNKNPELVVEALVPDFGGNENAIRTIIDSGVDVVSHNIETVGRLSPEIRDRRAGYRQSLGVLAQFRKLSDGKIITKSGLMAGLGETEDEVKKAMEDLRGAGVEIMTIGQYLQPTRTARHIPVKEYILPETFEKYKKIGYELGFCYVASGPFVRSSYKAAEPFISGILKSRVR